MVKPHYEMARFTTEICTVQGQSIVESRLAGGEIASVLAVHAHGYVGDWKLEEGRVQYSGKVTFTIVYEDAEKRVCRVERGVEFSHRAEGDGILPSHIAQARTTPVSVKWKREGGSLYVSAVAVCEFTIFGEQKTEYLSGGEGLIVKREDQPIVKIFPCIGKGEADDSFETDYVADVLTHSEQVHLLSVEAGGGEITFSGEVALNICAMKEDGSLCCYERLIPFRMEALCEDCMPKMSVSGEVYVQNANLSVTTDEEKGKSKMSVEIDLTANARLYQKEEISVVVDAYSPEKEIVLKKTKKGGMVATKSLHFTERVSGTGAISSPIDFSSSLLCCLCPKVELAMKQDGEKGEVEGCVLADLIVKTDGIKRRIEFSLPFVFPVSLQEGVVSSVCGSVCGLFVRQRKEGEVEAEATVKVCINGRETLVCETIEEAIEGEVYEENDSGISIYMPHAGDGLWETAKRLRCDPKEVEKINPDLQYPLTSEERIFVYRQKN